MGWKNVKEHYRIEHIVSVYDGKGICIGSPYIHDIIVIGIDGVVTKRYDNLGSNKDLTRYQVEFDADPEQLKRLIQLPDSFDADLTVYTYDDGEILEKKCAILGWPNITHDGHIQYENTFSEDKSKVIAWAKRDLAIALKWNGEHIAEREVQLVKLQSQGDEYRAKQVKLNADFPDVPAEKSSYEEGDG
jgi:hypothetical protein